jgi:hypothetical protein
MSGQRSHRATALVALALAAVVAAVFLFGDPTANPPGAGPPEPRDPSAAAAPAATPPAATAAAPDANAATPAPTPAAPGDADPFAGVDVQLARVGAAAEPERLPAAAEVRIGERLRIGISSDRELHVYAFNQVLGAAPTVMFPLPVLDTDNPLPPGEHELPGTVDGAHQSYTVEANAPSEDVLLLLSGAPVPALESRVAALAALTMGPRAGSEIDLDQIVAEAGSGVAVHRWTLRHVDAGR